MRWQHGDASLLLATERHCGTEPSGLYARLCRALLVLAMIGLTTVTLYWRVCVGSRHDDRGRQATDVHSDSTVGRRTLFGTPCPRPHPDHQRTGRLRILRRQLLRRLQLNLLTYLLTWRIKGAGSLSSNECLHAFSFSCVKSLTSDNRCPQILDPPILHDI